VEELGLQRADLVGLDQVHHHHHRHHHFFKTTVTKQLINGIKK